MPWSALFFGSRGRDTKQKGVPSFFMYYPKARVLSGTFIELIKELIPVLILQAVPEILLGIRLIKYAVIGRTVFPWGGIRIAGLIVIPGVCIPFVHVEVTGGGVVIGD